MRKILTLLIGLAFACSASAQILPGIIGGGFPSGGAAVALVSANTGGGITGTTGTTATFAFNAHSVTSGDTIVCSVFYNNTTDTLTNGSVTDSLATSYAIGAGKFSWSTAIGDSNYWFYGKLASSGTDTVTLTVPNTGYYKAIACWEVQNAAASPFDGSGASANSNTTNPTVSAQTPTVGNGVALCAMDASSGNATAGGSPTFTLDWNNSGVEYTNSEHLLYSSTSSITGGFTITGSWWGMSCVLIKGS